MIAQIATCRYCLQPIRRGDDAWWLDVDGRASCDGGAHQPIPRTMRDEP